MRRYGQGRCSWHYDSCSVLGFVERTARPRRAYPGRETDFATGWLPCSDTQHSELTKWQGSGEPREKRARAPQYTKRPKERKNAIKNKSFRVRLLCPGKSPTRTSPVLGLQMDGYRVNQDLALTRTVSGF